MTLAVRRTGWDPFGSLVRMLLLTGQRRSEVSDAQWPEFESTKTKVAQGKVKPWSIRKGILGAEPILDGHDGRAGPVAGEPLGNRLELCRLHGDDRELGLGQRFRTGRCANRRVEIVTAGDTKTTLVQGRGVLVAPAEDRGLADAAEMAREEAADDAGSDYADALDRTSRTRSTPRAASPRGSSRQRESGNSASEKISRSKNPFHCSASRIGPNSITPSPGSARSFVLRVGSRQSARWRP